MVASCPSIVEIIFFFFHNLFLYKKLLMIGVKNNPKKKAEIAGSNILKIDKVDKANSKFLALIGPGIINYYNIIF